MESINLSNIVRQWQGRNPGAVGNPRFSALKLKLSTRNWTPFQPRRERAARSFEMRNASPAEGQANLQAVKESKPVTTVCIRQGCLTGYPKKACLELPPDLHPRLGKVTNIEMGLQTTQVIDPTKLQVDAAVNLARHSTTVATVDNSSVSGNATFQCEATLSGDVLFDSSQIKVVQILKDMQTSNVKFNGGKAHWTVTGDLQVNFEDNHSLRLSP